MGCGHGGNMRAGGEVMRAPRESKEWTVEEGQ